MGISIVSVIILLGVLIFAHELGHFLMAKWAGVRVLKFSLGFGPRIIGRKIGETEYLFSLIPLGGYVKLLGESPGEELSAEEEKRSFLKQTLLKDRKSVG
jgi:regulator of sigma E protease